MHIRTCIYCHYAPGYWNSTRILQLLPRHSVKEISFVLRNVEMLMLFKMKSCNVLKYEIVRK